MAQTLKFGKGTWATKTGSSMAYNDQNGNYKPLPFNVERDSIATRVNKEGLIEVVGKDKLRIDYTDSAKGVALLENSSTNILTYSEDFIGSYWLKLNNVTVSAEKVISPDGTLNASQLIFDGTSGGRIEKGLTGLTQGADYSVSVYARVSSGTQVVNFGSVNDFEYTLTTEWQRLTSTEAENDTNGFPRLKCNDAATIEVWGFQLEQSSFPTSYIKSNSGGATTRAAETCNGSGNAATFNDSEGVLMAEIQGLNDTDITNRYISLTDGTATNALMIQYRNSGELRLYNGGTSTAQIIYRDSEADLTENIKVTVKYGTTTGSYKVYINGFSKTIEGAFVATAMSGLDELKFEYASGSNNFYGKTKQIQYFDSALTDTELEQLTSWDSFRAMAEGQLYTIE